jgi:hypothetical protein
MCKQKLSLGSNQGECAGGWNSGESHIQTFPAPGYTFCLQAWGVSIGKYSDLPKHTTLNATTKINRKALVANGRNPLVI